LLLLLRVSSGFDAYILPTASIQQGLDLLWVTEQVGHGRAGQLGVHTESTHWNSQELVFGILLPAQKGQPTAGTHCVGKAGECRHGIVKEHYPEAANHDVAGASAQRAGLGVTLHESHVTHVGLSGELAGDLEHGPGQVKAYGTAGRSDVSTARSMRRHDRRLTTATANVEHALPRRNPGSIEQMRKEVPVSCDMPFAISDPILSICSVPTLRLSRISSTINLSHSATTLTTR
jgi:hypothetical protein